MGGSVQLPDKNTIMLYIQWTFYQCHDIDGQVKGPMATREAQSPTSPIDWGAWAQLKWTSKPRPSACENWNPIGCLAGFRHPFNMTVHVNLAIAVVIDQASGQVLCGWCLKLQEHWIGATLRAMGETQFLFSLAILLSLSCRVPFSGRITTGNGI